MFPDPSPLADLRPRVRSWLGAVLLRDLAGGGVLPCARCLQLAQQPQSWSPLPHLHQPAEQSDFLAGVLLDTIAGRRRLAALQARASADSLLQLLGGAGRRIESATPQGVGDEHQWRAWFSQPRSWQPVSPVLDHLADWSALTAWETAEARRVAANKVRRSSGAGRREKQRAADQARAAARQAAELAPAAVAWWQSTADVWARWQSDVVNVPQSHPAIREGAVRTSWH